MDVTPSPYTERTMDPVLRGACSQFPVVVLTGPRQSGKTTLLRRLFGRSMGYVSLDPPEIRAKAVEDPRGFLDSHAPPVIFDEIQNVPVLLPYIKERVDERRTVRGQYVLTGSHNLLLLASVTESLAGRAAILRLLPLTYREMEGVPRCPPPWEGGDPVRPALPPAELWRRIVRGAFPELHAFPDVDTVGWHDSYSQTLLDRDVRIVRQVADLVQFQTFVRALAARTGGLLDLSSISRDVGVVVNTVRAWLSTLEAMHQIIIVRPYHASLRKRLVKTPKVYFTDTGTLCHLVGLRTPEHAMAGPMGGALFENAVVAEVYKTLLHRGESPRIYFWRTATGVEVDLLVEVEMKLVPIEIKLNSTPRSAMADGILSLRRDLGEVVRPGFLVHTGEMDGPLVEGVRAIPFGAL